MTHGLLHCVSTAHTGEKSHQQVLPVKFKAVVLKVWPKMSTDIEQYVRNFEECVLRKTHEFQAYGPSLYRLPGRGEQCAHHNGPSYRICSSFSESEPFVVIAQRYNKPVAALECYSKSNII